MAHCQHCDAVINDGFRLCRDCRRDYSRQLHELLGNMDELRRQTLRQTRIDAHGGSRTISSSPSLIDMSRQELFDHATAEISEMARTSDCYGVDWRHQLRMMIAKGRRTCQTLEAGRNYAKSILLNKRIAGRIERHGARPFVGVCPACGADIEAERWQTVTICECGQPIDLAKLSEATHKALDATYITRTPKGAAEFIRDQTGIRVDRNAVTTWIKRGRLQAERLEDGYWRIPVGSLLRLAERKAKRQ
ncbi:hypothetical protein [Bifidobacterium callitrichos]|uniref:PhnA protein n=1 Tax=Bifidobacterium callitrichos DSM 23973 TaxID=1437609 RepID=A0A087ACS2_9BIFI|nr:hypothetical protein [Bifidobacterium callitrichos]KFI56572.1 PhnA protein [Bifidobacterium callitrichos DSM 23973]